MCFCALAGGLGVAAASANSAPVAAYSFDAGEGEVAEDITGSGHDGTIEGPEWTDRGRFGDALQFNGEEGECVTIPDAEDLRTTEELTLEAWVKPTSPVNDDPIIYKDTAGHIGDALGIGIWSEGRPEGLIGEGEGEFENVVGPKAIEANVWTHLAFTYDGAHMRLYVNGELVATKAQSEGPPWGEGDLVIGCNPNYSPEVFDGKIDEVRIYDRALGAGEIGGDSAAPIQTPQKSPVAAYSFDAGEGETLQDITGSGHDGTIEGPEWTDRGKYGNALSFNGESEDCVTVPDESGALQLTEELTLEAWVKPSGPTENDPIIFKEALGIGGQPGYAMGIGVTSSGKPEGVIGEEGESENVEAPSKIDTNVWTHLAFTYDGAHMRLYVNGELVATQAQADAPLAAPGDLKIGCSAWWWEEGFDGKIDEVRIYDRALGAGEIGGDSAAPIQTPQKDPVAAYSFDAGEGEVAEDITGSGHDGTIEGPEWTDRGRFGDALQFNGEEGECVTIPDAEDLRTTEELTLEAWVKPTSPVNDDPIIYKDTAGHIGDALGIGIWSEGRPEGLIGEGEGEFENVVGPKAIEANVWTHLAFTYDGAHMRLYVNGELVATKAQSEGPPWGEGDLVIGCNPNYSPEVFDGKIDEVRIYDRALGAGEIGGDSAAPIQTPQKSPVAAYSFDAGEGETLQDITGSGHDGTIEGPEWTDRGKYGNALSFNGESEDCVTVPDESGALQLTEELTLEAWVKPSGPTENDPIIFKEALGIGGQPGYAMGIGVTSSGKPEGVIGEEGESENVEAPSKIDTNVWTHLAFTYDGAHMRLYVNGELVATQAQADAPLAAPGDLKIGCSAWWWEEGFDGKIDEVRIYDRALGAGEIGGDSAAPIQTPQKDPVAAYSFDAGEGEVAEDITGSGHDGTIEGPEWTDRGRFGDALQFNGEEGECVTIPDAEDLRTTEELTLEAWVKPTSPVNDDPIIYKDTAGHIGDALGIGIWSEGRPEGLIGEGEGEFENVVGPKAIEANVWTHLAFTYDGAHMRLYVNGELVATKAQSEGPPWGEGDLVIGCNPNYSPEVFDGKIDEVRIYDRALGAGEIEPDTVPPTQPAGLNAIFEEGPTAITWNWSLDPPNDNGTPASGVFDYSYRFQQELGTWSPWQDAEIPAFQIPETNLSEQIRVQVYAQDRAGNVSPVRYATLQAIAPTLTPADLGSTSGSGAVDIDPEPAKNEEEPSEGTYEAFRGAGLPAPMNASNERLCEGAGENPCGHYDAFAAGSYAQTWSLNGESDSEAEHNHNHKFRYQGGRGGDCTNFVSQALHFGGMRYMRANGFNTPNALTEENNNISAYEHGQGAWWSLYADLPIGGATQRYTDFTRAWAGAYGLYEHLTEYNLGHVLGPNEPIHRGDVVFYSESHELKPIGIEHTQIVSRIDDGAIWVAQHSKNYERKLGYVIEKLHHQHRDLGKDYEFYFFRPEHAAANIG